METVIASPFNATQLHLLKMFSYSKSENSLKELQSVLFDYYRKKLDEETDRLWAEGKLNDDIIEEMLHTHQRTPYK